MPTAREVWLFDLDGCLVDSFSATLLRPGAREVLGALRELGVSARIWSAGGADYAERVARRLGIRELVDGCVTKVRGPDGRWVTDDLAGENVVCVDDQVDGLPAGVRQVRVLPYLGGGGRDREFEPLLGELQARLAAASRGGREPAGA